jgi:hypothetical protein
MLFFVDAAVDLITPALHDALLPLAERRTGDL